jgi:hypothetical protein
MTQEALPALPNQNDEEAVRGEKGPEILILSLAQDTRRLVNKCDWIAQFALFSQFVTCLGRIVHHSPRATIHT